jgi:hypothetical protein
LNVGDDGDERLDLNHERDDAHGGLVGASRLPDRRTRQAYGGGVINHYEAAA